MTKIAKISLDIRKNDVVDNEPIILRQGDSDVIIEASISNNGYPNIEIDFATFVAKKPDGTIISNDPVNISGNVISYPISKHLTESVGKIQDAYFMINNQITTCGFDISIIPSAQLDGTSVNYIPGIESINKFLESAEADWLGRIQQMKAQIDGLDIPNEFKLLMDKALSDAKTQYQPTIDAAEANVENIVADLAAKKLDLTNNSDELNTTIAAIKAQVASINSFLDNIQKQIIDANASFTADQQAKISQSIADGQKKLADSIASMQSEVAQSISDLKAKIDALTVAKTGPKGDKGDVGPVGPQGPKGDKGDTGSVDNNGLISAPAFVELKTQVDNSAVGTNLLINTGDNNDVGHPVKLPSVDISTKGSLSRTEEYTQLTAPPASYTEMFYRFSDPTTNNGMYGLESGQTYTIQGDISVSKGTVNFRSQQQDSSGEWIGYDGGLSDSLVSDSDNFVHVSYTFTVPDSAKGLYISLQVYGYDSTTIFRFRRMKLEKGSVATDYSVNPEDILSREDVQTAITNALSDVNAKVKELETKIDKLSPGKQ